MRTTFICHNCEQTKIEVMHPDEWMQVDLDICSDCRQLGLDHFRGVTKMMQKVNKGEPVRDAERLSEKNHFCDDVKMVCDSLNSTNK